MANQMIALQARAPQSSGLGSAIQQNAQMINMLAQQRASQRQAEQAQQKMAIEAELAGPQLAEAKSKAFSAEQKALTDFFDVAAKVIGISKTPEDVLFGADMLKKQYNNPIFAQIIDQTIKDMPSDPQAFGAWRNRTKLETMDAKDQVPYYFEQLKSKEIIGEGGTVGVVTTGGIDRPPTLVVPKTYRLKKPAGGQVDLGEQTTVEGGQGGPDEGMTPMPMTPDEGAMSITPGDRSSRLSADLASPLMNVKNDAEYQVALQAINRVNPDAAAQIKQLMPRFDPARIEGIRAAAAAEFNVVPQGGQPGLVVGERGGMGGPLEGYVESSTPFRARVPAPPSQPQPPKTKAQIYEEELAREQAKIDAAAKAPPPKPEPLTEAQRLARRDALAGNYKKAQGLLDKTYGPEGIIETVNAVRNLSRDQKEAITGYSGYFPSVRSSSKDADTAVQNLKDTVTELGKEAAAATGAIGPMAVQEWKIVAGMIANLDLEGMTAEGLNQQLNRIEAKAKNAARLTQQAYDAQHGADVKTMPEFRLKAPGGPKGAPKPGSQFPVMTPEQVKKARPGTKFRRSDNGQLMVKL